MAAKKGITQLCNKCNNDIGTYAFKRHYNTCNGRGLIKRNIHDYKISGDNWVCPICNSLQKPLGMSMHIRIMHLEKSNLPENHPASNQFIKFPGWVVSDETRHKLHNANIGKHHTQGTKDLLSRITCERLEKHSKYSKNTEYAPGIILESSYEVRTAIILDKLNVKWIKVRKGYEWLDNGKIRRYIPDFYLEEYDLFLDPKNDYLIKKDAVKIESAQAMNKIKVIILTNSEINEEFISKLLCKNFN